jgi:hypothetical protein
MLGRKVGLLAQLRLPLEISSKRFTAYKRILFFAPHSLPCSSVRGTDVPRSQYRYRLKESL